MDELPFIIYALAYLAFMLAIVVLIGHGTWVFLAWVIRSALGRSKPAVNHDDYTVYHAPKPTDELSTKLLDLSTTAVQLERFKLSGALDENTHSRLMQIIDEERVRLKVPPERQSSPRITHIPQPVSSTEVNEPAPERFEEPRASWLESEPGPAQPVPTFFDEQSTLDNIHISEAEPAVVVERKPRRSFAEVLNSFMEESNIRWGEIIGGLLIIGCSTALVVSLWAQISEIPVLKFLIFTTVTAVLFGVGLYTEHRWKLPTTSRGILTIATLLVPLNFLAIAAVSSSSSSGALVIASELMAPAIFLCLVYFAGRVITPECAHLLSAGVLGSSIGQLLVRHFASPEVSPAILVLLGAFPVVCYLVTSGLALRLLLADNEIDEHETNTVFTMLGAMSFSALLPFGLLLYKSASLPMTMMYMAPIVTAWGLPMLATGTILYRRIYDKKLVASRVAGTALAIIGVVIVLSGVVLAWPNPASIVPAALLSVAVFTALAIVLDIPIAHLIAAFCLALAYLVGFHVLADHIRWVNLRAASLLAVCVSSSSGNALVLVSLAFLFVSEQFGRLKRIGDQSIYFIAACSVGVISLMLASVLDLNQGLWLVLTIYSLSALWVAVRRQAMWFSWVAATLLLLALGVGFGRTLNLQFPWQTSFLVHATICAVVAIISLRSDRTRVLVGPLNIATLLSCGAAIISLFQTNPWQVTSMQAERVFWLAGVMLMSLWLNRRRSLFIAFQIMVTAGAVLSIKALLQQFDWYTYLPHAFLHPWGLQIQGTILALLGLIWISLRIIVRQIRDSQTRKRAWIDDAWRLLDMQAAIDRVISWGLLVALFVLAAYGSLSGVTQELAARGSDYQGVNIAGFPHQEALGLGSWVVLGLVTVLMLGHVWERRRNIYVLGALAASAAIVPLLAGRFEDQIAVATAWRWLAAVFLLIGAVAIWFRNRITQWLASAGWPQLEKFAGVSGQVRTVLINSTLIPIGVLTYYPAVRAIYYLPVRGPISGLFSWLGDTLSYSIPLVVVVLVMIGFAVRERLPRFAFYGSLLFNSTITLIYLLSIVAVNGPMDRLVVVTLLQLNAISFSAFALFWLSFKNRWEASLEQGQAMVAEVLLQTQMWMAIGLNLLLIVPLTMRLTLTPSRAGLATFATGDVLGWFAFLITTTLGIWILRMRRRPLSPVVLSVVLVGMSCLISLNVAEHRSWTGLHALKISTVIVSWLLLLAANLPTRVRESFAKYVTLASEWSSGCWLLSSLVSGLSVWLSFETLLDGRVSKWWSVMPLLSISALSATLNWQTRRRFYLFSAAILFTVAVSIWAIVLWPDYLPGFRPFILINITLGSLASILWLALDLRARRVKTEPSKNLWFSVHSVASTLGFLVLSTIVLSTFKEPIIESGFIGLTWSAFAALTLLMTACIWDRATRFAVAGLYLLGLVAAAIMLSQADLTPNRLSWAITILLSSYTLITALAWHLRKYLIALFCRFNAPKRIEPATTQLVWLTVFNLVAVATVVSLAYWIDLRFASFVLRSTAGLAVISQSAALGLMAEGKLSATWRRISVALFWGGAILLFWSGLTPGMNGTWLNRSVIVMLGVFGLTALYGALQSRLRAYEGWNDAVRACLPWALGSAVVSLMFCLATEVFYQVSFGAVRINWLSLAAIGLTLVGSCVACILFAISPEHDPLALSEKKRAYYVYVAEAMLALLFLHIRLTMPWLFTGFLERYWPLVVMFVAYVGVTVSEMLRKKKLLVLAEPMERTGALLPLLPVLGFWIASSEVDFSMLLFLTGGLYGLLSILRRSLLFGALAVVCGNGALWYMLHRTADYQFLQHPQLWLIPVALSVLVAAYLNEERLNEDQMASVRYLSLVTVYASSTADIFISGVENSPWLPLILGVFSLAGVFSGIIFRIRGLLLLGSIFLLLSIVTMIWFASANLGWTWLWYVAGIATGATIIFMFAVFEKKRSEVLRVVEGFKEWER